eukprot:2796124-Pyramimonas_sp.AAC.1
MPQSRLTERCPCLTRYSLILRTPPTRTCPQGSRGAPNANSEACEGPHPEATVCGGRKASEGT